MVYSSELYLDFLETIPFSTILVDSDGNILNNNKITEKIFGLEKGELVARYLFDISIFGEFISVVKTFYDALLDGLNVEPIEILAQKKDTSSFWISLKGSLIQLDDNPVVQIMCEDITVRKIVENAIRQRLKFEGLITDITSRFLGISNINEAIKSTLADIGIMCGVSRCYLFLFSENNTRMSNTHEWCAEGVAPQINNLQNLFCENYSWGMNKLYSGENLNVKDLKQLPESAKAEKNLWEKQRIKSFLVVPVFGTKDLIGFLGFDDIKEIRDWNDDDLKILQISSHIIGPAIERKQMEEGLRESEEKYRLITENVSDSISIINSDFYYVYVNKAFSDLMGYTIEDLKNKKAHHFISPNDIEQIKKYLRDLFKKSGEGTTELRFRKKSGEYIWIESKGRVFVGKDKNTRLISVTRDISEQKKIEETLKTKSTDCIFIFNVETRRIIETNFSLQHLLGYSREDLLKLSLYDIAAYDLKDIEREIHQILKEQSSFLGEHLYKKSDGSLVEVEVRASIISYGGERVIYVIAHDITVQKLMERKLTESERKHRVILENVKDAVIIISFDGKILYQSPQFPKLIGRERLESDLISLTKHFHEDDIQPLLNAFWRTEDEKEIPKPKEVEFRVLHQEGYYIWLSSSTKIYYDEEGKPSGYIVSLRDVTEHKLADKKLKESEERYRYLFERSPFLIVLVNKEGKIINCNAETLGYRREDLLGKNFLEFKEIVQAKDFPKLIDSFRKLSSESNLNPIELQIIQNDGTLIWVLVHASLIEIGDDILIQGIVQDITSRKIAESNLAESEEKYRELFESSPNSIILMDMYGTIQDCNNLTVEYFGFSKQKLIGDNLGEITKILQDRVQKKLDGEDLELPEFLIHKKDGSPLWVSLDASLVEFGKKQFIQAIIQDITSRKLTEQKLKESEAEILEKNKLAAVGQLAAGVAHELNTPLANINLTIDYLLKILKNEENPPDSNAIKEEILIVNKQVEYCAQIVRDLLQFSRKMEINSRRFNLYSLLREILENPSILIRIDEKNIEVYLETNKDIDIIGDRDLLFQVFQNLIQNAIDAFEEVSHKPQLKITISQIDNQTEIQIIDNGIGIKEENLPRIFEPFFTTKGVGKGTGLGLSISRGIIEKHGGNLNIKSVYRRGTRAIVTLPLL